MLKKTVIFMVLILFAITLVVECASGSWNSYANRYAVIVMGGPSHTPQQYDWYWGDTSGMYNELRAVGFTDENIYFISWGDSAVAHPEIVDKIGCSLSINVPNGHIYFKNGDFITTSFSLPQNAKAYSVAMNCLDDNNNDSSSETFECAITSDQAGNNVLTSAQVNANFRNDGTCKGHRYVFNFTDVNLSANTTYYLRSKVLSGAVVRSWIGATLYWLPTGVGDCYKTYIKWAFNQIKNQSRSNDLVYIFWIDHGNNQAFELLGDDITHTEYNNCIKDISAKVIIGAYNPCFSGAIINDISRSGVISITSVNDNQSNKFGWAGTWRNALKGGTSTSSSDKDGDGYISMAEAYEWVAPKSQACSPKEHPWLDDNGDSVGSEYGTSGYDASNLSKDGWIASIYSLNGWKKMITKKCPQNLESKCWGWLCTHTYDLGRAYQVTNILGITIAGPSEIKGRVYTWKLQVSSDNRSWQTIGQFTAIGATKIPFEINSNKRARYVRIWVGSGCNSSATNNGWIDYSEIAVFYK